MLLASMLMLYMSGWLFLRQNPAAWNATLYHSAERAISSGTALSLASIAFLAVFASCFRAHPLLPHRTIWHSSGAIAFMPCRSSAGIW
jgi:hypothetical protein